MSPAHFNLSSNANVFCVGGSSTPGYLSDGYVDRKSPNGVRPVISLKSCVLVSNGSGASSTPYEVEIDSTCASAVN